MRGDLIEPTDLRDFAKSRGWVIVPEAVRDRRYVLNHPDHDRRQLVFPMDTSAPDYEEAVRLMVERLAELDRTSPARVLAQVLAFRDDTLRFRVLLDQEEAGLPLAFAASMVAGAEQLLRAAACTVMKPQRHYARLSRSEAQQLVEVSRFRHTEPGSFVLRVSCPVQALDLHPTLRSGEREAPFVRRATRLLEQAIHSLVEGIEGDRMDGLLSGEDVPPLLSSNLCEALLRFQDPGLRNSLEFAVDWAPSLPEPRAEGRRTRIQKDYFPRIEEVRRALRRVEGHRQDSFVGTVEHLAGEMGDDNRRAGEVVLSLLLPEGEVVRARVQLTAEQYAQADRAHMTDGVYVKVTGKLQPGRQPRLLTEVSGFEVIEPTAGSGAGG